MTIEPIFRSSAPSQIRVISLLYLTALSILILRFRLVSSSPLQRTIPANPPPQILRPHSIRIRLRLTITQTIPPRPPPRPPPKPTTTSIPTKSLLLHRPRSSPTTQLRNRMEIALRPRLHGLDLARAIPTLEIDRLRIAPTPPRLRRRPTVGGVLFAGRGLA